ncbi:MAG TPA: thiamine phosphate synthase [Xanthobacteraceae bacterium]|jgi:thiamine-phosphate pyrophosphorylase|nr:thiamine phosphate synthase [Xanthobacteraceae bacterium]
MASRDNKTETRRPGPRLYLISPEIADPAAGAEVLATALANTEVAAVLLRLAGRDERSLINIGKKLAPQIQSTGAAVLIAGHPEVVARIGADGAHLNGIDAFNAARADLQPERIAGCGGLRSRHDAMLAGEAGADYVLFGDSDPAGWRPSLEAIEERVRWWAEIFEPPCVAVAGALPEIDRLVAAGADFIACADCIFTDPRGPGVALAEAAQRLVLREATA